MYDISNIDNLEPISQHYLDVSSEQNASRVKSTFYAEKHSALIFPHVKLPARSIKGGRSERNISTVYGSLPLRCLLLV